MTQFIPNLHTHPAAVPFFEDSREHEIPGRATEKNPDKLQREIIKLMTKLGGYSVSFIDGIYPGTPKRYGYRIEFKFASAHGRIDCAALPLRNETKVKKQAALAQALYLLRDKLQAMVYASVYEPDSIPLVPYLIGADGKTVTEFLIETGNLPALGSGIR